MSKIYEDKAKPIWFIYGFIPVLGLIMFLIMRNSESDKRKKLFYGLISSTVVIVFVALCMVFYRMLLDPVFMSTLALLF